MSLLIATCLSLLATSADGALDIGKADQKDPPPARTLVIPKTDEGVKTVGVLETVRGTLPRDNKKNVYFLVNPLSSPSTKNLWWIQRAVTRDGDEFQGSVQFGEAALGQGEYFVVLTVVTEKEWEVGQMLTGIPRAELYSKPLIVKRSR